MEKISIPNAKHVLKEAYITFKKKSDIALANSIHTRIENYSTTLRDNPAYRYEMENEMAQLNYDLLTYSLMLPFRIVEVFPKADIDMCLEEVGECVDFATLFVDTFKFYVTGDKSELPVNFAKKVS